MADITASVVSWSTTESGNQPTDSTAIGAGLDDNLRAIQAGTAREFAKGGDLSSASTVDIGASGTSGFVDITGSVTITSLGTARAGLRRWVRFTGSLTLTHNATSLILPGGANITTQAGDVALFVSLGSGNWVCAYYPTALALANIRGSAVVGSNPAVAAARTLQVVNTDGDAASSASMYAQSDAGILQMTIGASAGGGSASLVSSATGALTITCTEAVNLRIGTNNRPDDIVITPAGVVLIGGIGTPTGYASLGDVALPAARGVRANNTAKAWVRFDGTPTGSYPITLTPVDSFGVASITKNAVADYTITFAAGIFANANYCAVGTAGSTSIPGFYTFRGPVQSTPTATEYRCRVSDAAPNYIDVNHISIAFFGD